MMVGKFLWLCAALSGVSNARVILKEDIRNLDVFDEDLFNIEPHIFESKILQAINKLKEFLKNGDPENQIPPVDPLYIDFQDFDFIIEETILEGFFKNVTIAEFSNFEPTNVEFKLLPLHFKIDIFLPNLKINGSYKLVGNIFDEIPVNGTGNFILEAKNMNLSLYIKPTQVNSSLQIKDLIFECTASNLKINYTNELENDKYQVLNETLALYVFDKIQEKYIPLLLNTGKLVLNHFLLSYSFKDVMKMIMDLLTKN